MQSGRNGFFKKKVTSCLISLGRFDGLPRRHGDAGDALRRPLDARSLADDEKVLQEAAGQHNGARVQAVGKGQGFFVRCDLNPLMPKGPFVPLFNLYQK